MDSNKIVLNTLVFDAEHNNGLAQPDMLQKVADFGIKTIEVRREYFKDITAETTAVKENNAKLGLTVFYSVPEKIFTDTGDLNPELSSYFEEAKTMGVSAVKMNIGNFTGFNDAILAGLSEVLSSGIQLNVENDQTEQNGSSKNIINFLEAAQEKNLDIKFVFDLGNWRFVDENEQSVANAINKYVRYIHVKNVTQENGKTSVVALDKGIINWQSTLKYLPTNVPVALEYPATNAEIQHGIDLLVKY
ncbi:sugar phosphate isomerase/epimerase family protein [Paucilactobacillus kaifaensis]|uniref:sugar phosphate isomerase/epimerase family protein n=1 Tax=Paucilactobacillus kaifaensis TaxID=2559921 RepID=UPI0010F4D979|nr:TIM barrel protein [Paucilactobacillus kaifaensis]